MTSTAKELIYNLSGIRPPITGIGRYALELIKGQIALDLPVRALIGGNHLDGPALTQMVDQMLHAEQTEQTNARKLAGYIPFSRDLYRLYYNYKLGTVGGAKLLAGQIEHDINYSNPKAPVLTLFDTSHIRTRTSHPSHRIAFLTRYFETARASDSAIITISDSVKAELITSCGIHESRIHVTPLAADSTYGPKDEQTTKAALAEYGLIHQHYILSVATLEPRKNLSRVLDAYEQLSAEQKMRYPLVIAGARGWKSSSLKARIHALSLAGSIIYLGHVPEKDLPALYSGAAIFLFPSLYEGFGLPLLEAMQSGCACITSNHGALAEVSGGAAVEVDALETDQIYCAIEQLLYSTDNLSRHRNMSLTRAKDFTWSNTIKLTRDLYETL